jgi:23S rRNA C2498 (ribose-2'-O)-methylase RlmM
MKGEKTGGRQKGTPNRLTKEIRNLLKDILFNQLEGIEDQLNQLQPKDRIEAIIKLCNFVLPKVQQVNHDLNEPTTWEWD